MRRKAQDWIPGNILKAAKQAGLDKPLWYIGRTRGVERPRQKTLADLAREGRETGRAGTKGDEAK